VQFYTDFLSCKPEKKYVKRDGRMFKVHVSFYCDILYLNFHVIYIETREIAQTSWFPLFHKTVYTATITK